MPDRHQSPVTWMPQQQGVHQPHYFYGSPYAAPVAVAPPAPAAYEAPIPPHNDKELNREALTQVLDYFSQLIYQHFSGRPIRLVVHGGACMLLHPGLYALSQQQQQMSPGLPRRTTTRDVDYIHRSFVSEMMAGGVPDAAAKLAECVRGTARAFGLGADWMNSDADIALPHTKDPSGKVYDPVYSASIQPHNIQLHTIYVSPNKMLTLISVTPFWAVSLKLVRYAKWDPGDICLLLRNGTVLSGTNWTPEELEQWLYSNCWAMGYAHWDSMKKQQMKERIAHAIGQLKMWNEAVGVSPGSGSNSHPHSGSGQGSTWGKEKRKGRDREKEKENYGDVYSNPKANPNPNANGNTAVSSMAWAGRQLSAHDAMGGGRAETEIVGGGASAPSSGWTSSFGQWPSGPGGPGGMTIRSPPPVKGFAGWSVGGAPGAGASSGYGGVGGVGTVGGGGGAVNVRDWAAGGLIHDSPSGSGHGSGSGSERDRKRRSKSTTRSRRSLGDEFGGGSGGARSRNPSPMPYGPGPTTAAATYAAQYRNPNPNSNPHGADRGRQPTQNRGRSSPSRSRSRNPGQIFIPDSDDDEDGNQQDQGYARGWSGARASNGYGGPPAPAATGHYMRPSPQPPQPPLPPTRQSSTQPTQAAQPPQQQQTQWTYLNPNHAPNTNRHSMSPDSNTRALKPYNGIYATPALADNGKGMQPQRFSSPYGGPGVAVPPAARASTYAGAGYEHEYGSPYHAAAGAGGGGRNGASQQHQRAQSYHVSGSGPYHVVDGYNGAVAGGMGLAEPEPRSSKEKSKMKFGTLGLGLVGKTKGKDKSKSKKQKEKRRTKEIKGARTSKWSVFGAGAGAGGGSDETDEEDEGSGDETDTGSSDEEEERRERGRERGVRERGVVENGKSWYNPYASNPPQNPGAVSGEGSLQLPQRGQQGLASHSGSRNPSPNPIPAVAAARERERARSTSRKRPPPLPLTPPTGIAALPGGSRAQDNHAAEPVASLANDAPPHLNPSELAQYQFEQQQKEYQRQLHQQSHQTTVSQVAQRVADQVAAAHQVHQVQDVQQNPYHQQQQQQQQQGWYQKHQAQAQAQTQAQPLRAHATWAHPQSQAQVQAQVQYNAQRGTSPPQYPQQQQIQHPVNDQQTWYHQQQMHAQHQQQQRHSQRLRTSATEIYH